MSTLSSVHWIRVCSIHLALSYTFTITTNNSLFFMIFPLENIVRRRAFVTSGWSHLQCSIFNIQCSLSRQNTWKRVFVSLRKCWRHWNDNNQRHPSLCDRRVFQPSYGLLAIQLPTTYLIKAGMAEGGDRLCFATKNRVIVDEIVFLGDCCRAWFRPSKCHLDYIFGRLRGTISLHKH